MIKEQRHPVRTYLSDELFEQLAGKPLRDVREDELIAEGDAYTCLVHGGQCQWYRYIGATKLGLSAIIYVRLSSRRWLQKPSLVSLFTVRTAWLDGTLDQIAERDAEITRYQQAAEQSLLEANAALANARAAMREVARLRGQPDPFPKPDDLKRRLYGGTPDASSRSGMLPLPDWYYLDNLPPLPLMSSRRALGYDRHDRVWRSRRLYERMGPMQASYTKESIPVPPLDLQKLTQLLKYLADGGDLGYHVYGDVLIAKDYASAVHLDTIRALLGMSGLYMVIRAIRAALKED